MNCLRWGSWRKRDQRKFRPWHMWRISFQQKCDELIMQPLITGRNHGIPFSPIIMGAVETFLLRCLETEHWSDPPSTSIIVGRKVIELSFQQKRDKLCNWWNVKPPEDPRTVRPKKQSPGILVHLLRTKYYAFQRWLDAPIISWDYDDKMPRESEAEGPSRYAKHLFFQAALTLPTALLTRPGTIFQVFLRCSVF